MVNIILNVCLVCIRVLKRNKTLVKMELDNNQLSSATCKAFGEALLVNSSLVSLSLDSNPLLETGNSGFASFADALRTNTTIVSLNLWRCGLDASNGNLLANCLEENETILFCDVGHNTIDMSEQRRISEKLDSNVHAFELRERSRRTSEESVTLAAEKRRQEEQVINTCRLTQYTVFIILIFNLRKRRKLTTLLLGWKKNAKAVLKGGGLLR